MRLRQRAQPESSASRNTQVQSSAKSSSRLGSVSWHSWRARARGRRVDAAGAIDERPDQADKQSARLQSVVGVHSSRLKVENRRKRDGARTGGAAPPALGQRRLRAGTVTHVRARSTPAAPCAHTHYIPLLGNPQAHFRTQPSSSTCRRARAFRLRVRRFGSEWKLRRQKVS